MSYADQSFWDKYGEYLKEVRDKHRNAVRALECLVPGMGRNQIILDLGCGQFSEAKDLLMQQVSYFGVDAQGPEREDTSVLNYRSDTKQLDLLMKAMKPTLVTSLFSSEITALPMENAQLYHHILNTCPTVSWLLLAGFYYTDKTHSLRVEETGGLQSYQTLDLLGTDPHKLNELARVYVPVPSKLFGPNVVEVWRVIGR